MHLHRAEYLILFAALCACGVILHLVRKRDLREKYALGWLGLSVMILFIGATPRLMLKIATWANVAFPTAVLFFSLTAIFFFAFSVSVSLSRSHRRQTRLTQEIALLEHRLRELETRQASNPSPEKKD